MPILALLPISSCLQEKTLIIELESSQKDIAEVEYNRYGEVGGVIS